MNPRTALASLLHRLADALDPPPPVTARARTAAIARHPSSQVLDDTSIAYGRADLQLVHGARRTDPDLN